MWAATHDAFAPDKMNHISRSWVTYLFRNFYLSFKNHIGFAFTGAFDGSNLIFNKETLTGGVLPSRISKMNWWGSVTFRSILHLSDDKPNSLPSFILSSSSLFITYNGTSSNTT